MYIPPICNNLPQSSLPLSLDDFTYTDLMESDSIIPNYITNISLPTTNTVPVAVAVAVADEEFHNIPNSPPMTTCYRATNFSSMNEYHSTDAINQQNTLHFPVVTIEDFHISNSPTATTSYCDTNFSPIEYFSINQQTQSIPTPTIQKSLSKQRKCWNCCSSYIKKELSKAYTAVVLANSHYNGGMHKFKDTKIEKIMPSLNL